MTASCSSPNSESGAFDFVTDGEAMRVIKAYFGDVTWRQLEELAGLRESGMAHVRAIDAMVDGTLSLEDRKTYLRRSKGIIPDFTRVCRAVRQIMTLEQELMGLRPALLRVPREPANGNPLDSRPPEFPAGFGKWADFRNDENDYDTRPMHEVVAWVRETLHVAPPEDDPFAPVAKAAKVAEPVVEPKLQAVPRGVVRRPKAVADFVGSDYLSDRMGIANFDTVMPRERGPP